MTNKEKLIKIYNKALEKGYLNYTGLCGSLSSENISRDNLFLYSPNKYFMSGYWAYGGKSRSSYKIVYEFTPLRQTILAFLIAMEE